MFEKRAYNFRNILITFVSILFMGISICVLKMVDYGMDSFTYMNVSIAGRVGWTLGNWQMILNIILFIPVIFWGRKQIGLGTVLNMVMIGYTVDLFTWIFGFTNLEKCLEVFAVRVLVMLISLVVFVFAAAFYMSTELGTSPFDALPLMIHEKLSGVPFKFVRFAWDFCAVLIGFAFSRQIGIVTILMVLTLGQTIEFVRNKFFPKKN